MVRSESTGSFQFLVRRGSADDSRSHLLGKLQGENGNATRAKDQHRVARLDPAIDDQRPPGCQASTCQCRRFDMTVVGWDVCECGCRAHHYFAGISINAVAGNRGKIPDLGWAVLPLRKEARDHRVSHGKLRYALADSS